MEFFFHFTGQKGGRGYGVVLATCCFWCVSAEEKLVSAVVCRSNKKIKKVKLLVFSVMPLFFFFWEWRGNFKVKHLQV